jgi:hypothetical protein
MNTAVFDEAVLSAVDRIETTARHFPAQTVGLLRRIFAGISPDTLALELAEATSNAIDLAQFAADCACLQLAITTASVTEPGK